MILWNNSHHSRNLRVVFVISPEIRGRKTPREFLHRNPWRRRPLLLNIERVQYAIRRPSSLDDDDDAPVGLIHRHNFPARIRCARSFTVFVEIDAIPRRTFRELG